MSLATIIRRSLRSPSLRFLLIFCTAALLGFSVEVIPWVDDHLVKPLITGLAWLSGTLIRLAGGLALVSDDIIRHPVNGFAIKIANGCSGLEAAILLAAGMMAFPASWRQRSWRSMWCASSAFITLANTPARGLTGRISTPGMC
jgi:hypothetical protein